MLLYDNSTLGSSASVSTLILSSRFSKKEGKRERIAASADCALGGERFQLSKEW